MSRPALPMEIKLAKYSRIDHVTLCQVWFGVTTHNGYGEVSRGTKGRNLRAHRAAYEYAYGPIPTGMHIDHLCKNRACINPLHLEVVTPGENTKRGDSPSMRSARSGRCMKGHEYTHETTYTNAKGQRHCRICRTAYAAAWYLERKRLND